MAAIITCERCGKEFSVRGARKDKAKYCSRECHQPPVISCCIVCQKEFRTSPSTVKQKYCSLDCYWETLKGVLPDRPGWNQNQKTMHKCEYCGTEFSLPPNKVKRSKRLFCSQECMGLASRQEPGKPYTKDDLERMYIRERMPFQQIANVIDSTVWVVKRILEANGITFRNRQEWGEAAWKHADEKRIEAVRKSGTQNMKKITDAPASVRQARAINAAIASQTKKGPTSIEIKMMQALDRESISYVFQFPVGGKFLCDFKLSDCNIIIECDGIYWHSKPAAKIRDKGKNAYLHKCGYRVLRFTDKQIDCDVDECVKAIREHMASDS